MALELLMGCVLLEDGTYVMRAYPALLCDEVENRREIGWIAAILICFGVPAVCTLLLTLYLGRKFNSPLSYFLVRSVFAGHKDSALGFGYRVFSLIRVFMFIFVITSPEWQADMSQSIGMQGLLMFTIFVVSLTDPRTTRLMTNLEALEELIVYLIVIIGFSSTGEAQDSNVA
jgi:hypothetical protein